MKPHRVFEDLMKDVVQWLRYVGEGTVQVAIDANLAVIEDGEIRGRWISEGGFTIRFN